MPDADVALQLQHVALLEHVPDQAVVLAHGQLALVGRHDPGRILAAVLQYRKRVVQLLVDRAESDDAYDAAHDLPPRSGVGKRLVEQSTARFDVP